MKLFFDRKKTISVGDQSVFVSARRVKVGTSVEFFSQMGEHLGTKPIAKGVVVGACKDDPGAPVTPTKTGRPKRNAWRFSYRAEVTKINKE